MQRHLCRRWRDHDRIFQIQSEQLLRQIDGRGIHGLARDQIDPVERLPVAAEIPFAAVAVRRVVVDRLRDVGEHHRLEVEGAEHLVQAGCAFVRRVRPRIQLRVQQRRSRNERRHAGQRLTTRERSFPLTFFVSH
jgi:hypothetical protein